MILSHKPTKILITGRSGSGKTTYWTRYLLGVPAAHKLVFDHQGELAHRLRVTPATGPAALAEGLARGWSIFDPSEMFPGRLEAGFAFWCELAFQASTARPGRKIAACDELQVLVGTNQVSPELCLVLETGRRYGLDFAAISQAPNLIHNRIRNQLTEVVAFVTVDPRGLDWLEAVGFSADQVRTLRPGSYIARSLISGAQTAGAVF